MRRMDSGSRTAAFEGGCRAPARRIRRRRLRARRARRAAAGKSPGVLRALAGAECARRLDRPDQPGPPPRRAVLPARAVAGPTSWSPAPDRLASGETRVARPRAADRYREHHPALPNRHRGVRDAELERRMRAAVHLRQHRQAEGLHAVEPVFPAGRRMCISRRAASPTLRPRAAKST